jgi:gas vesicle protein
MAAAWFLGKLPFISTYRFGIQLGGIIATVISIWFLGAASNEAKWQAAMDEAKKEKEAIEAAAKKANEELSAKLSAALNQAEDLRRVNNTQASALSTALKSGTATVTTIKETVVQNMTAEEKATYDKMNAEQKAAYDKKIADLLEQYKQCPSVPAFNVDEIEKKLRPQRRTEAREEKK